MDPLHRTKARHADACSRCLHRDIKHMPHTPHPSFEQADGARLMVFRSTYVPNARTRGADP
jgi:hypothetical protein